MLRSVVAAALLVLLVTPATADVWQMKQRDMHNTGRGDFSPTKDSTIFDTVVWQTAATGSSDGAVRFLNTSMAFYDGAGPEGADVIIGAIGGYGWEGLEAMDRHTGTNLWSAALPNEWTRKSSPAFSNDGAYVYIADTVNVHGMETAVGPPAGRWDNTLDANLHLSRTYPTIGPDGRIFLHQNADRPYAGTDLPGSMIMESWAAATPSACSSDPALYQDGGTLKVIAAGWTSFVQCWDGDSAAGTELWVTATSAPTRATPTIDPATGNIYVPAAEDTGDTYIVGLTKDGNPLPGWGGATSKVVHVKGAGETQVPATAGCLSHDAATYYFQGINAGGTGKLFAVNTADGTLKWSYNTGSTSGGQSGVQGSSPIVTPNGVIIVGNNQGNIYYAIADDGTQGTLLDTLPVPDGHAATSAILADDGLLYLSFRADVGGTMGQLYTAFQLSEGGVPLPGDVDGNGVVDGLDLTAVLSAWETVPGDPLWDPDADLDGNDVINGLDLTEVISNWTMAAAAPAASASATQAVKPDKRGAGRGNVHKGRGNVRGK